MGVEQLCSGSQHEAVLNLFLTIPLTLRAFHWTVFYCEILQSLVGLPLRSTLHFYDGICHNGSNLRFYYLIMLIC